jgi:hypothetical protein
MLTVTVDAFGCIGRAFCCGVFFGAFPTFFFLLAIGSSVSVSVTLVTLGDVEVWGIPLRFENLFVNKEAMLDAVVCSLGVLSEYDNGSVSGGSVPVPCFA